MDAEREQLDLNPKMNAGNVANADTGPMNVRHVVEDVAMVAGEEAVLEDAEADLRKYMNKLDEL